MEQKRELITFDKEQLNNLPAIPTYQLENCYTILNHKSFKELIAKELLTRKDLSNYKIVRTGGNIKTITILKPTSEFLNYFLELCESGKINLIDYLNWEKITTQYGTTFDKKYFNVEIEKEQTKTNTYIRKK